MTHTPPASPGRSNQITTAQRVAGALLLLNAALVFASALAFAKGGAGFPRGIGAASALIDIVIGVALVRGSHRSANARGIVGIATLRAAGGLVLLPILLGIQGNPVGAVAQAFSSGGMLLLLVGHAGTVRMVLGAGAFGLCALLGVASIIGSCVGQMPLAAMVLQAAGEVSPLPPGPLKGVTADYRINPPRTGWYLRSASATKRDNPLADLWIVRPDTDAHVLIIAERVPNAIMPVDPYADQVVDNIRKGSSKFQLTHRGLVMGHADVGRVAGATATVKGLELEYYVGTFAAYDRGFQVVAFAPRNKFAAVAEEFRAMVESFELPPDALDPPVPGDVEPQPAGKVIGIACRYTIDAPSARWHLRKAEAAKKDNALIDRWLTRFDRDAHVFVLAEHAPGQKIVLDAYVDAVIENVRTTASSFSILSREPVPSDPAHGRRVRMVATVQDKEVEYYYAVYAAGSRGFQVAGFAAKTVFPQVEEEIRKAVDSFVFNDCKP